MGSFLLRRIIGSGATLLLLVSLTFFALRLAPGGPFDTDHAHPPEVQAMLLAKYRLDQPLLVQFQDWMGGLFKGDLGNSYIYTERPILEIITESLPTSLLLGALALALALGVGLPIGALAAWKPNTWWDASAMFLAVSGVSLPAYLTASFLILVFSLSLGWLPAALWESPSAMVLPAVTLALRPLAMIARLTRSAMRDAFQADYLRTARAKGLPERLIVFKHALKNAFLPVLTYLGPTTANLITGSFLVEKVFEIPGLGKHFVAAVMNRDYTLVMGVTLVYGAILIVANLLVDLLYSWVDPRIRME